MSNAVRILPHYTYDDYVHWQGRWELIDGIPFSLQPSLHPTHQLVAGNVAAEFRFRLKDRQHYTVVLPIVYKIKEDTIFQPDLLVVRRPIEKRFLDFPPVLIAEVSSPSTEFVDKYTKLYAYQKQGIPYYLIVSPGIQEVEIYELENGEYQMKEKATNFNYIFRLEDGCEIIVDFGEIWE